MKEASLGKIRRSLQKRMTIAEFSKATKRAHINGLACVVNALFFGVMRGEQIACLLPDDRQGCPYQNLRVRYSNCFPTCDYGSKHCLIDTYYQRKEVDLGGAS